MGGGRLDATVLFPSCVSGSGPLPILGGECTRQWHGRSEEILDLNERQAVVCVRSVSGSKAYAHLAG